MPTTVRRTVAFSPAVYLGKVMVEDVAGVRCGNLEEAKEALVRGMIPVLVDEQAQIAGTGIRMCWWMQFLQKESWNQVTDAAVVIGVGPGFTAWS